jgi:hypothetical protein
MRDPTKMPSADMLASHALARNPKSEYPTTCQMPNPRLSSAMTWNEQFLRLFDTCTARYQNGERDFDTWFTGGDLQLLEEIGYKTREFFDFVEDFCDKQNPTSSTALLIAAVRRDYFHTIQKGQKSDKTLTHEELPTFGDTLNNIAYLPRIIAKARAKLRGELDPDIMYSCGGDLNFLKNNGDIHPADFLRQIWSAGDDDQKLANWVLAQSR